MKKANEKGVCIHLPPDSIIADKFDANADTSDAPSNHIPDGWMGLDIGPNACDQFCNVDQAKQNNFMEWANGSF